MLQNFSNKYQGLLKNRWARAAAYVVWVLVTFFVAVQVINLVLAAAPFIGIDLIGFDQTTLVAVYSVLVYGLAVVLAVVVPRDILKRNHTNRQELGLGRTPSWMDFAMAPAGLVVYLILSSILMMLAIAFLPSFDAGEVQDVGFSGLYFNYEYVVAFLTLVVLAPIAEEILFRGYLLGKLARLMPVWLAVVLTALVFGLVHGAWNLAIDTFALGLVLGTLRIVSGSIWASALLHMLKNGIAFYLLFINPSILNTIGG